MDISSVDEIKQKRSMPNRLFIHGLAGSSQGIKPVFLRNLYPDLVAPDFPGDVWERMARLQEILGDTAGWTLIGSSLGGLMATVFACQHPAQVDKLVLLAPALPFLDLDEVPLKALPPAIPVTVFHGSHDEIVPLGPPSNGRATLSNPYVPRRRRRPRHKPVMPQIDWRSYWALDHGNTYAEVFAWWQRLRSSGDYPPRRAACLAAGGDPRRAAVGLVLFDWRQAADAGAGLRFNVPDPQTIVQHRGFVFSNHVSFFDTLVMAYLLPMRFISKAEVKKWPFIGWIAAATGTQFVDREDKTDAPPCARR